MRLYLYLCIYSIYRFISIFSNKSVKIYINICTLIDLIVTLLVIETVVDATS